MTQPATTAARGKHDRLKQMADEGEREFPEDPIAELLDLERALKRTLPKMRKLKAARIHTGAGKLAARVGGMCREMEELLSKENDQLAAQASTKETRKK